MTLTVGVPAHAFHVIHQGTWSQSDHFEVLALQEWAPSYADINRVNPAFAAPTEYMAWSGDWAANDFQTTFPNVTYTRTFFPLTWFFASNRQKTFVKNRQGRTAMVATWALESAANTIASPNYATVERAVVGTGSM